MEIKFTIQNYRCFGDKPIEFVLKRGITAFIGANNSGKSTLLRFFFECRPLFAAMSNIPQLFHAVKEGWGPVQIANVKDWKQILHKGNPRDVCISIESRECDAGLFEGDIKITLDRSQRARVVLSNLEPSKFPQLTFQPPNDFVDPRSNFKYDPKPVAALFEQLTRTLYLGPYRSVGDIITSGEYFDMQVGRSFVERWNRMKTGDDSSANDTAAAVENSIQQTFKLQRFQINATEDKQSLQITINDAAYKVQELGSGLAQFIICLAHAAVRPVRFILIDEPESNLHASMQLSFVTALASHAEDGLLFSSHSLGLARSTADTIHVVNRTDNKVSSIQHLGSKGTLSEIVGELNFSAYQELGFSVLLLVEGPTEIKCLQQFLRKLRVEQHILMVPLGGSSMINGAREDELRELLRITSKIFALVDSEKRSKEEKLPADRIAFKKTCEAIGIDCQISDRRALDNYFSDRAVKEALGEKNSALGPFDRPSGWDKSENWRIAEAMTWPEIAQTDLGRFLQKLSDIASL